MKNKNLKPLLKKGLLASFLILGCYNYAVARFWGYEERSTGVIVSSAENIERNSYGTNGMCVEYYYEDYYVMWIKVSSTLRERVVNCQSAYNQ